MTWREETIGDCRLINADCMEVLETLSDVHHVVTDPPYGIKHKAHSNTVRNGWRGKKDYADAAIQGDDSDFDPSPWIAPRFYETILWGANHYASRLPRGRWLAWNKLGHLEPWDSFSDFEVAWHSERGADRIFSLLWKGLAQGEKIGGGERFHPTMKPIALMEWCLSFMSGLGPILDPYMGSGTTGIACIKFGRPFIGIEIEPKYFDIACRRIEQAYKQPDMFIEQARKPVQESLL